LGYGEDKMRGLLKDTLSKGYKHFKLKVGSDLAQDKQRLSIAREIIGFDQGNVLMVDANQVWSVPEAIEYMKELAEFKPWFIEEPTSPDDGESTIHLPPSPSTPCLSSKDYHEADMKSTRRSPRPQSHPRSPEALQHRRGHGRNVPEPRHVQAIPRLGGH
jgi:L-alanine-DL-glutamate epimerase-like enolase superfamily enzyme